MLLLHKFWLGHTNVKSLLLKAFIALPQTLQQGCGPVKSNCDPDLLQMHHTTLQSHCRFATPVALLPAGNPMAWYSSPPLAYSIYLPMSLAATALPYALTQRTCERAPSHPRALQSALLGYALVISLVAALSVALGMGSGYLFAAWGICALLAAGFVTLVCYLLRWRVCLLRWHIRLLRWCVYLLRWHICL